MAIAQVQVAKNDNGATNNAIAVTLSASGGANLIWAWASSYGAGSSNVPTITDSQANTWTQWLTAAPSGSYRGTLWYLKNCPSGVVSATVTPTARSSVVVCELSGADTTSPADAVVAAIADQAAVTAYTSNSIVTAAAGAIFGIAASTGGANVSFASSGAWATLLSFNNAGDGDDSYSQKQLSVTAGTYSATGTCTSTRVYSAVFGFKAAAGGAAVTFAASVAGQATVTADTVRQLALNALVTGTATITNDVVRTRVFDALVNGTATVVADQVAAGRVFAAVAAGQASVAATLDSPAGPVSVVVGYDQAPGITLVIRAH